MMRTVAAAALLVVAAALRADAAGADVESVAKLRSADAAARLEALKTLADEPASYLAAKRTTLRPLLVKMLAHDASPSVRGTSARVLARLDGDDALPPLLAAFATERDPAAERLLPEAFEELAGDAARKTLSQAASDPADPRRGALAAEALGRLPKNAGFDDLVALLDAAPHWAVASGACLGLGRIEDLRSVPALIPRLRHPDASVRAAARESLVRLTSQDQGTDPAKWEAWWDAEKKGFRFPEKAPTLPTMRMDGTADRPMGDGDATFARFFGVELRKRRCAFLIDYSQSMWGPRRAKAEEELVGAVKGMPTNHTFAVELFNEHVWWFKGGPLPARPQEKLDLVAYLAEQVTRSYTNIYDALEDALGLAGIGPAARAPAPGLDEMVILSDGYPNRGKITEPKKILEAIRSLDAGRVVIDAVALGDGPGELLPALAKENGGKSVSYSVPR